MEEIKNNIEDLKGKIENEGTTRQGRLSAAEFNLLVEAVIEAQKGISILDGYFTPISETEYEALVESGELEERPYFIYEE